MHAFKLNLSGTDTTVTVHLNGVLDETSVMNQLDLKKFKEIEFDLLNITRITSNGLRLWLLWIKNLDQKKKYTLSNCGKIFIDQANMVCGLVPQWMKVTSIELPYFCEACGKQFGVYHPLKDERAPDKIEDARCPTCGKSAEFDADPDKYFRFLKR